MPCIQQFFCDAVGQKGLAYARVPVKEQIGKGNVKFFDKFPTVAYGVLDGFKRSQSRCRIAVSFRIKVIGKRFKIFVL